MLTEYFCRVYAQYVSLHNYRYTLRWWVGGGDLVNYDRFKQQWNLEKHSRNQEFDSYSIQYNAKGNKFLLKIARGLTKPEFHVFGNC